MAALSELGPVLGSSAAPQHTTNPLFKRHSQKELDGPANAAAIVPISTNIGEAGAGDDTFDGDHSSSGRRLRRTVVASSSTKKPGWCVGNTAYGLFILSMVFIIDACFLALHCTPLMDELVDEEGARTWVQVTTGVVIFAGILLVPAILGALRAIWKITCCWRRTVREVQQTDEVRDVFESKSAFMTAVNFVLYFLSPASKYFFVYMYVSETKEFVVQAFAVDQMSRAGIGREALTVYTCVMLLNGTVSLGTSWLVGFLNGIGDEDTLRRKAEASRWIPRLLLFDASCDLVYSFFGLVHLLLRLYRIMSWDSEDEASGASAAELQIASRFATTSHQDLGDIKAFMLLSEGENALFGGKSFSDILIKFLSRVWPLLQAPLRVIQAFTIRQSLSAGDEHTASEAVEVAAAASSSNTFFSTAPGKKRSRKGISRSIRHFLMDSVTKTAFERRYKMVPRWLAGMNFAVVVGFFAFVQVRLW